MHVVTLSRHKAIKPREFLICVHDNDSNVNPSLLWSAADGDHLKTSSDFCLTEYRYCYMAKIMQGTSPVDQMYSMLPNDRCRL